MLGIWGTLATPAFQRLRRKTASSTPAWATYQDPMSKKKKKA
jgi:hypothetical protein